MFTIHRTYISELMTVLGVCFPTVVVWIISPHFQSSLIASETITFALYLYTASGCSMSIHPAPELGGQAPDLLWSMRFYLDLIEEVLNLLGLFSFLLSHSCHSPREEQVQVAPSPRRRRDRWGQPKPNLEPRAEPSQLPCRATGKKNKYLSL